MGKKKPRVVTVIARRLLSALVSELIFLIDIYISGKLSLRSARYFSNVVALVLKMKFCAGEQFAFLGYYLKGIKLGLVKIATMSHLRKIISELNKNCNQCFY